LPPDIMRYRRSQGGQTYAETSACNSCGRILMPSPNIFVDYRLSRRQWLQTLPLHAFALGLFDQASMGASGQTPAPSVPPLNRFPRMVQEFFVEQVRVVEQVGLRQREALQTSADAEAYVRAVREKIRRCF